MTRVEPRERVCVCCLCTLMVADDEKTRCGDREKEEIGGEKQL
jgi:hypothetical protein